MSRPSLQQQQHLNRQLGKGHGSASPAQCGSLIKVMIRSAKLSQGCELSQGFELSQAG